MTHFSLCSGIGGLDLAAEWAGFETIGQCEVDEYASQVLAKNFKGVKNYGDIRTITNESVRASGIEQGSITVLSAGFPCQPYSLAGKGLGDGDERDLWNEVARCIKELKPRWFVGENTPGLFSRANQRYFARVVNDLSALGYSVSWGMWGACDVGAAHKRDRVFIVAHSTSWRGTCMANAKQERCKRLHIPSRNKWITSETFNTLFRFFRSVPKPYSKLPRNDDGLSKGMDRIRCLGNAVVPQQAYPIFKAIADIEQTI